jgi:hypothetical protein
MGYNPQKKSKMKKRPLVAVLNTIESGSTKHVIKDTTLGQFGIVKTSANKELLLGLFKTATLKSIESFDPVAENQQVVLLGASATKETIVAETRYKVEIGNVHDEYETSKKELTKYAYTSPSVLTGDADSDRLNVYTALVSKINAYAGNNCTAYLIHEFDFTDGADTADSVPTVGATYTQETSGVTGILAAYTLSSGTFAGDDAAGTAWIYNTSDDPTDEALDWTGETSITLTQTDETLILGTGLACVDDAGYFVSSINRTGQNAYYATQGFSANTQFVVAEAPVYAMGIGSVMAALQPSYDKSKQDAIDGRLEFELVDNASFDTSKTYRKYVFNWLDGGESALSGEREHSYSQVVLYADYASGNLGDLNTGIEALLS